MPYAVHLGCTFADQTRRLVLGVLVEEFRKLAIGGEGGLDGDNDIAREVGNACDCRLLSALRFSTRHLVCTFLFLNGGEHDSVPASPAVRMEAILPLTLFKT